MNVRVKIRMRIYLYTCVTMTDRSTALCVIKHKIYKASSAIEATHEMLFADDYCFDTCSRKYCVTKRQACS